MDQADGKRPLEEPVEPDAKSQRLEAEAAQAADAAVEAALGTAEPAPAPERTRRRRSGWDEAGDGSQVAAPPAFETPMSVPPGGNMIEFKVEQSMVGFLIGKGGENLKSMETSSTATIKIDQGTKEMGYSMIRVTGSEPAVATAKALLDQRIAEKTSTSKPAGQAPSQQSFASFTSDPAVTNGTVGWECQLEQSAVGFFIGKQGEYIKRIQAQTGATIVIDQDTKEQGYSMIRIMEGPGLAQGAEMVRYRIEQVKEAALQRAPAGEHEEITVQQHLVGAIIGRGGETLKQIKSESGATVVLTQDTKDQGFSVVRFGGPAECVARAVEMVRQRLAEREAGQAGKGQGKGWEKGGSWGDNGGFGSGKGGWGEGGCAGINPPPPPPPPAAGASKEWGDGNWNGNWGNDNSWGDNSGQWGNNSSNGGCCGGCDSGCGNYGGCNGCGGCGDFNAACQGGCCSSSCGGCGGCGCAPPPPPPPPPTPAPAIASTGPSQEAMLALQALQSGGPIPTIRGPESQQMQQQQQQPVDQFQQMQMDQLQQQQLMQQQQMQLQQQQLLQQQQMQQQQMQYQPQADYTALLAQQLSQPLDPNTLAQQQLQQQAFVQPAGC